MLYGFVLILSFLLKLRFPPHRPLFDIIRSRYGAATVRTIRQWENTAKKLEKAKSDIDFLKRCSTYNIIPKFLKFKLYRENLQNTPIYREFQRTLLDREIGLKYRIVQNLHRLTTNILSDLKCELSWLDFAHINRFINTSVNNYVKHVTDVQRRKFIGLGGSYDPTHIDPNKCIFNLSNYVLNARQTFLLSLGLDFCLPNFKFPKNKLLLSFELLLNKLKYHTIIPSTNLSTVIDGVKTVFRSVGSFHKKTFSFISRDDMNIIKKLGKNKDIKISRPDKGNGVVIMNTNDCHSKMDAILSDNTKFRKCKEYEDIYHSNIKMEDKINYFIRKERKSGNITEDEYKQIYVSGSSPAIMYGLPKIHKDGVPLRPILAAFKAPSFSLAKFIVPILSPLSTNEHTLKNSYEFKELLDKMSFPIGSCLASFDVTSLFTNVPIEETIDIATNAIYEGGKSFRNMTRTAFRKMLKICTEDSHFIFNNNHYTQFEGFAMGSPLSAIMANLFLCHHEKIWLDDCPLAYKPILYKIYVNDTFLLFRKPEHASTFLAYLNSKHPNIKFTMELESNDRLSFLDTTVTKNATNNTSVKLMLSIFRKATFTGLGMNFHSFTYHNFKLNNIRTLLHRAYTVCSTWIDLHSEITFLTKFFKTNGYPEHLVQNVIFFFV